MVAYGQQPIAVAPHPDPDSPAIRLERLPLAFETNVGQADAGTDYLVLNGAMQAEFSAERMRLSLPTTAGGKQQLSIRLMGARGNASPHASDKLGGESNYLVGATSAWHLHLPLY